VWERIVGQDKAIAQLERALTRPVHAYLFAGPSGCGVDLAAQDFAAALIDADPARVARGRHPDVAEFEPAGVEYRVVEVREQIIPEILASPVECPRKVVILHDVERLNDTAANALLRSLEEPPDWTHIILVTANASELLDTVRSRCVVIDFASIGTAVIEARLQADGIEPARAHRIALVSGGRLDRAHALAGPLATLTATAATVARRIDGTGTRAAQLADDLIGAINDAVAAGEAEQAEELQALEAEIETAGYSTRVAQGMRRRATERQKRRSRRARIDAVLEVLTALERMYRDTLAADGNANDTDPNALDAPVMVSPRAAVGALDALRAARNAVLRNASEGLLLEHVLLQLPPAGAPIPAGRGLAAR
jgi:DNA polymerase-3 subunit delta'